MTTDLASLRALVLCGGAGTRLRAAVATVPKVLAPVAGRPFLDVLIGELHRAGLRRIVLLCGYLADQVAHHVDTHLRGAFPGVDLALSVEPAPLGTAGAIKHAARFVDGTFFVVNGDTYLELDAAGMLAAHRASGALVTLAAVEVDDTAAYGALELDAEGGIRGFAEKTGASGRGLINAGAYVAEPALLDAIAAGRAVSLERETFPALVASGARLAAYRQTGAFVDIGTPERWAALSKTLGA